MWFSAAIKITSQTNKPYFDHRATLIISDKEMEDIVKIVKLFEE